MRSFIYSIHTSVVQCKHSRWGVGRVTPRFLNDETLFSHLDASVLFFLITGVILTITFSTLLWSIDSPSKSLKFFSKMHILVDGRLGPSHPPWSSAVIRMKIWSTLLLERFSTLLYSAIVGVAAAFTTWISWVSHIFTAKFTRILDELICTHLVCRDVTSLSALLLRVLW